MRRAVLSVLLVVGIVTAVYAVVQVRSGSSDAEADDVAPPPTYAPSAEVSDGPLRLGEPLVAGRYGSPVDRPAGTMESFDIAMAAGVDHIEARVALTQDDVLVVRGDIELSTTTDVAEKAEFADRRTTKVVDGESRTGWFTDDFTLAELETLRAVEAEPAVRLDAAEYDGQLSVIGFDTLLERLVEVSQEQGRRIGLFVEPLEPAYFRSERTPIEGPLGQALRKARLTNDRERVTIESDDVSVLERLEVNLGDNVLTALVVNPGNPDLLTPAALEALPDTVDAVAVAIDSFLGQDAFALSDAVHAAGYALVVFPISFENDRLVSAFTEGPDPAGRGDLKGQVGALRVIGTDVILAEAPAEVIALNDELAAEEAASSAPAESPAEG